MPRSFKTLLANERNTRVVEWRKRCRFADLVPADCRRARKVLIRWRVCSTACPRKISSSEEVARVIMPRSTPMSRLERRVGTWERQASPQARLLIPANTKGDQHTTNKSQVGNLIQPLEGHQALIIGDRPFTSEGDLDALVSFICLDRLANGPDRQLRRQTIVLADISINTMERY
jgi:hypothetical protein